jgi:hypothetical protein
MKANGPTVPDLLRRFVETPYAVSFALDDVMVRIETNEFAIVNKMHSAMVTRNGLVTEFSYWKLVRDESAAGDGDELTILSEGPLSTLLSGTGTVITVDRERSEVLGFLARDLSVEKFVTTLLPIILELSQPRFVTAKLGAAGR